MNTNRVRYVLTALFAAVMALSFTPLGFGQGVTTSSISGFVRGPDGKPVIGATITVTHVPSGSRHVATTRANGEYNVPGLRPGGPYTVTASAPTFPEQTQTDINLDIGGTFPADFYATPASNEVVRMEAMTVGGSRDTLFDSSSMGTTTTYSSTQVQEITSVRQDVQDLENLDPRTNLQQSANGDMNYTLSVQGQNPRENLFLIDGVSASDNFGLNSDGYAGLRNPLPLPWIESITVDINPYDIVYSNFLGAVLNASLKSGTNTFHGSYYQMYMGTNFRGPDPVVGALGTHEKVQSRTYGSTLSGPIIKDKLFFFFGYEAFREIAQPPAQTFLPDQTALGQILAHAATYGYQPGSQYSPIHTWEQNFVGKIDWNISDAHKFEFTFRHTDGFSPLVYDYTFNNETSLSASWYSSHRTDQSYTAKINSDWNKVVPGLTTEVEATFRRYDGSAVLLGNDGPSVTVEGIGGTSTAGGTAPFEIFLGPSPNYQYNALYTEEMEEHLYGEYSLGSHTFKFGGQVDRIEMTNAFVPNYYGSYTFSNVQDYMNNTPTGVTLAAPAAGYSLNELVAHYAQLEYAPVLQDTWKPIDRLTITGGLRLDYPYEPQAPLLNQTYLKATGQPNTATINGNYTISPRLGFNYDLPWARKTQIRGGAGLFLGAPPFVWLENSFSTAGQSSTYSINNSTVPIANYTFTGNPSTQPLPPVAVSNPVPSLDVLAPDYHMPANWKENIAIDHKLPWWDMTVTLEVDLSQVQKDTIYYNTNLKQGATSQNGVTGAQPQYMPDGAIRYAGNVTPGNIGSAYYVSGYTTSNFYTTAGSQSSAALETNSSIGPIYELANTDKGGSQEYTIMFNRPMKDNWAWSLGYTHTHATQVYTLGGTTAGGSYGDNTYVNPNDNVAYNSAFSVPDKVVAQLVHRFHFFPWHDSSTTFAIQAVYQTGVPYSYTFKGDADGSGDSNASLFYVPTGPNDPKVAWLSATEEANFFQWLAGHPQLQKYAGEIAPRNAFYSAWQRTINLHLEQQVPIWGPVRMTLFADCFNFANLLNKNWGIVNNFGVYNDSTGRDTVAGTGYNPAGNNGQGQYVYTFNAATLGTPTVYSDLSRWAVQIGARVEF